MEDSATTDLTEQIIAVLDQIRPALQIDGGNIDLISIEGRNVRIRLTGPYIDGPYTATLVKMGIERTLRDRIQDSVKVTCDNVF